MIYATHAKGQIGLLNINIFDVTGKKMRNIAFENLQSGEHQLDLTKLGNLSSGVYMVQISVGNAALVLPLSIVK